MPDQPRPHPTFQPAGVPLGGRFALPGRAVDAAVRRLLAVVDAVHGDGDLPRIPVVQSDSRTEQGLYVSDRQGRPLRLALSRHADRPLLTLAHEIGHVLDHQALGRPGEYASTAGRIPDVMEAIARSKAIRRLGQMQSLRRVRVRMPDGSVRMESVAHRLVQYLLRPEERFARAYAQYVATRSRDATLSQELAAAQQALLSGRVYHQQWNDDDFGPIAAALDRLFLRKGWIR